MQTISAIISGKVQGVFFRQSAVEQAKALGIKGTAANLPDGTVKIVATGEPEQIDAFLSWCHEGPRQAKVDGVHVEYLDKIEFKDFRVQK